MESLPYPRTTFTNRRRLEGLESKDLRLNQLRRLNDLLANVLPSNSFYQSKLSVDAGLTLNSIDELGALPFTTKQDLVDSKSSAGFAANLTYSIERYTRFHRTSGTRGRPMIVLDTKEDWQWWMEAWQYVLDSASIEPHDTVVMAFGFGPFIGFWSAFDAVVDRGAKAVPTGAMSTLARLELLLPIQATVLFCTPSYALHMAEVAHANNINLRETFISRIVVAGEPGGSVPAIKSKIETAWNARVIDHCGASEVGPWGFASPDGDGIYVNEAEFIPEFIPIDDQGRAGDQAFLQPEYNHATDAGKDQLHELVLTCLGRNGSPVIRYRTGDLVQPTWAHDELCRFVLLKGGVLGRTDDMMIIRGVNVFPTSVEEILRRFPEINEYRMTAFKRGAMDQLKIEIECDSEASPETIAAIKESLPIKLGFRVEVESVTLNSLPRFEAKGKRFVDQR